LDKTATPAETSVSSAHLGSPTTTAPVDELSLSFLPPVLESMAIFLKEWKVSNATLEK
jgi:hypothetical protein